MVVTLTDLRLQLVFIRLNHLEPVTEVLCLLLESSLVSDVCVRADLQSLSQ